MKFTSSYKRLLNMAAFWSMLLLSVIFASSPVLAAKNKDSIIILVSKKFGPYLQCEMGVKDFVKRRWKRPFEMATIYLSEHSDLETKEKISQLSPTLAICIGTRAAYFLDGLKPHFPWVATFLLDKSIESLKSRPLLAVSMDVPIEVRIQTLCRIKKHVHAAVLGYKVPVSPIKPIETGKCRDRDAYVIVSPFFSSIKTALQKVLELSVNSFFITADPRIFNSQEVVSYTLLWGLRNKIAVCGLSSGYVKNGALYSLEADVVALGSQAAGLALGYVNGKVKGETIIQHPDKLLLSINLKTAKRLGIEIPRSVMDEAFWVIE